MIYPVITLYQPWATWVIRGWKTIETRTHNRLYCLRKKTVLIHAGQKLDKSAMDNIYLTKEQLSFNPEEIVHSAILGSVYIDETGLLCGDDYENKSALIYTKDRYGLFLEKIEQFAEPIPAKGDMGIWYYDLDKKIKVLKPKKETLQLF